MMQQHSPRQPGRTTQPRSMAFFGSSLVSSYWNGAATYYRGIIRALHSRGWHVRFFEPDAYERQAHRDIPDPEWAEDIVFPATDAGLDRALQEASSAAVLVKASGVGVLDHEIEAGLLQMKKGDQRVLYWDVDAPATLERLQNDPSDPLRARIAQFDKVLTYGGGPPVVTVYKALGARDCVPIYNGLDPETHHPVAADPRYAADVSLLANRLPDREARIDAFFFEAARQLPESTFLLGGNGWIGREQVPENVTLLGHLPTADHNAFNCSATAVLSVNRESMARVGFSPATRVFEAAGAGACLITDAWEGIELFLEPEVEVLVARDGEEVADLVRELTPRRARMIGEAARLRVLAEHTYEHRVAQLDELLVAGSVRARGAGSR
jgi:spore maturation protein CgeB